MLYRRYTNQAKQTRANKRTMDSTGLQHGYNDGCDTGLGYSNSEKPYYYRRTMVSPEHAYAEACAEHAFAEEEYARACLEQARVQMEYAQACVQHARAQRVYAEACSEQASRDAWEQQARILQVKAQEAKAQQAEARAKEAEYHRHYAYETRGHGAQSRWERAQAAREQQAHAQQTQAQQASVWQTPTQEGDYYDDDYGYYNDNDLTTPFSYPNRYDRMEERFDRLEAQKTWGEIQELLEEANRKRHAEQEEVELAQA